MTRENETMPCEDRGPNGGFSGTSNSTVRTDFFDLLLERASDAAEPRLVNIFGEKRPCPLNCFLISLQERDTVWA